MADQAHRRVLQAEEFQFIVSDRAGELEGEPVDTSLVAFDPDNIPFLAVQTGQHWGPVAVEFARYGDRPSVPDGWQDIVEVSVRCAGGLEISELEGSGRAVLTEAGGDYRLRVCASGRDDGAALSYEQMTNTSHRRSAPVEHFLIQAWTAPMTDATVVQMASAIGLGGQGSESRPRIELEHAAAGRAASDALRRDLDGALGARVLSGAVGTAVAERLFTGTRRRLFSPFANPHGWMTRMAGPGQIAVGNKFALCGRTALQDEDYDDDGWYDVFTGTEGDIICTWLEVVSPRSVTYSWNWYTWPAQRRLGRQPFLATDSVVRIELALPARDDPEKLTPVRVQHSQLPVEWLEDMRTFWTWQLERADRVFGLGRH